MRVRITHFLRRLVSGALPLLLMLNPLVSPCSSVIVAIGGFLASVSPTRAAGSDLKAYAFPRADAADTLRRCADESGMQLVYLVDTVRGVTTNAIRGEFAAREALTALLANTGLALVEDTKTGALMVNRVAVVSAPSERPAGKVKRLSPLAVLGGWLTLSLAAPVTPVTAADAASISGTVSNSATGNLLEGSRVELPALLARL
jgi:hypothetical protein